MIKGIGSWALDPDCINFFWARSSVWKHTLRNRNLTFSFSGIISGSFSRVSSSRGLKFNLFVQQDFRLSLVCLLHALFKCQIHHTKIPFSIAKQGTRKRHQKPVKCLSLNQTHSVLTSWLYYKTVLTIEYPRN